MELHRKRNDLLNQISDLTQKQDYLTCRDPSAAIRPSPTGVAGAEPVPSRKDKVDNVDNKITVIIHLTSCFEMK